MADDAAERRYLLGLSLLPHIGGVRTDALLHRCGSAREAWAAPASLYRELFRAGRPGDLGEQQLAELLAARQEERIDDALRRLAELGGRAVFRQDPEYPALLRELPGSPHVLFVRGHLPGDALAVAIVGTRRASTVGRELAHQLALDLAASGVVVASGLARGIDAAAHAGALAGGGVTWAVLGSGLDQLYPPEHVELAEQILASGGCLLSQFPCGSGPERWRFPVRNQTLAGLAAAVVVVEAPTRSGALITAQLALTMGREVLAVPADPGRAAGKGCNQLLRQGAGLVESADDVLDHLSHYMPALAGRVRALTLDTGPSRQPNLFGLPMGRVPRAEGQGSARDEAAAALAGSDHLLAELRLAPATADQLARRLGWPMSQLTSLLVRLELAGVVVRGGDDRYRLCPTGTRGLAGTEGGHLSRPS